VLLVLVTLTPFSVCVVVAVFVIGEEPTHGFWTVTGMVMTTVPVNGLEVQESWLPLWLQLTVAVPEVSPAPPL